MDKTKKAQPDPLSGTIKLRKPVDINGKPVHELTYDAYEIDAGMFAQADALKSKSGGTAGMQSKVLVETDYGFQMYLGFMAIIAVNPDYDVKDLERVKGPDLMLIMRIGRNFTSTRSAEVSSQSDSDGQSETTEEPSTPQTGNSTKED